MENKLEYSYFNGVRQTKNCEAKDGRGIAVFDQLPSDFFKLAIEYQYLKEAERFDPELAMVINSLYLQPFKCASKTVSTKLITPPIIEKPITPTSKDKRSKESSALIDTAVLETIMQKVESAIRTKNLSPAKPLFTENGWKMFTALLENGDYSIISKPILSFTSLNGLVVCKSIPMQFRFKTNNKDFIEDVAFRFNEEKKISSISFTLTKQAVADLLDKEKEWDEKSKNILMQFLEDYQTAYALKRIDYLEKIFSDSALIIIGTELKNTVLRPEQQQFINSSTVVYEKKNKATFIADLARNFKSKSYINLRFEDISMAKSKSAEIYGVQVKQNYYSSNYNDKGYLTLLLDLTDTLPIIHVRVWQKEKNEKLSPKTIISVPYGWENGNW